MDEKRFNELYNRAYEKNFNVFTEFLNLEEQSELKSTYLPCELYGGYDTAERVVAGFGDGITRADFPISYIKAEPVSKKFADKLGHRDFLGAVMNLGIKREMTGDIIVSDNTGYLICLDRIAQYIASNLKKVRHTGVTAKIIDTLPDNIIKPPQPSQFIVASLRLDVLICAVFKLSRSECSKLFSHGKIFINSKLTQDPSYTVKENDIVSVRGFGRFDFSGQVRSTKKSRLVVEIRKY